MPDNVADEVAQVQMRILSGDFNGHLVELSQALQQQVLSGEVTVNWRFQFDGFDVTEADLTFDEFHKWSKIANENWTDLRPLKDSAVCRALLIVLLSERRGLEGDAIDAYLKEHKALEIINAFTEVEVVNDSPLGESAA